MGVIVQIVGSLLILAAFVLAQWGMLNAKSRLYLGLNVVGSAILAVDAALGEQWGFLLLEGVWAIISALSLVAVLRGSRASSAVHPQPPRAEAPSGE